MELKVIFGFIMISLSGVGIIGILTLYLNSVVKAEDIAELYDKLQNRK